MADFNWQEMRISAKQLWQISILNSLLFISILLIIKELKLTSHVWIVFALIVFGLSAAVIFIIALLEKYSLIPIYWFNLGAGIFLGLGTIPYIFGMYDQSSNVWYGGYSFKDVLKVSLINSTSIFLVLIISYFTSGHRLGGKFNANIFFKWSKYYKYLLLILIANTLLKLIFFPIPESLLIRGVMDKLSILSLAIILIGGMLLSDLYRREAIVLYISCFIICILGLMGGSKFDFILPVSVFFIGFIISNFSNNKKILVLIVIILQFILGSIVVNSMRAHCMYSYNQSLHERIQIVYWSTITVIVGKTNCDLPILKAKSSPLFKSKDYIEQNTAFHLSNPDGHFTKILRRFNSTGIASFLIHRYDSGEPGKTLENYYAYFIPRVIWRDKPIMTNKGRDLSEIYYPGQSNNSIAPTYSAELYWNYGWSGVVIGSIILGVILGVFSKMAILCANGFFNGYLLIAVPAILYAVWVENWLGSTYIGGLVSIIQVLLIYFTASKIFMTLKSTYNKR